jgi:GT2 family glycosyltransferase
MAADVDGPGVAGRVSVIVVSWNSREFLSGCLASVEAQTYGDHETIVVDNASKDGSADLVERSFPRAVLIRNGVNAGFCAANNAALKRATGVFILCLNPDAVLERDFLERALPAFAADRAVGMVAGMVHRFDGRTIDSAGQDLTRARRIKDRGYGETDTGRYAESREVFSVCGAVALYRRSMIDAISEDGDLFDETFFSFGEDMDVGWRARRAGWKALYVPSAGARHYRGGSQSAGTPLFGRISQMARRPPEIRAHIVKNRYLMILKNDTPWAFVRDLPFIAAWEAVQWGFLIFAAPSTLPHLWRMRGALGRAWRRRRSGDALRAAGA